MNEKTAVSSSMETDHDYNTFEKMIAERVAAVNGPVFQTDAEGLFDAYLAGIPGDVRQHYTCRSCRRFIERYGSLVRLTDDGIMAPVLWEFGPSQPLFFRTSLWLMIQGVMTARVNGLFYNPDRVWGTTRLGTRGSTESRWTHLSGMPGYVYTNPIKTAFQAEAEKKEEYGMLRRGMAEFPREAVVQAIRVLEADVVNRSEKALGMARWLLDLYDRTQNKHPRQHDNILWLATLKAPAGWTHIKTDMLGTLLADVVAGLDFESIRRRWNEKMHPLQYMRPTTPVSAGTVQAANAIVEKLGSAGALSRRFAKISDVLNPVWTPRAARPVPATVGAGPCDQLLPNASTVKPVQLPPRGIAWPAFRDTVLSEALTVEVFTGYQPMAFFGLVTAANADTPPILQWDGLDGEARNPVSWYFYDGGSLASQWGLTAGAFHPVRSIFLKPSLWQQPAKFIRHGAGAFFALLGAIDQRQSGGGFFPECLRSEYHGVRAAMEAYSNKSKVADRETAEANGVALDDSGASINTLRLRVKSETGTQEYLLTA